MHPANAAEPVEPVVADEGDSSAFDRFEEFTRRLVAVPKQAVDEARSRAKHNV